MQEAAAEKHNRDFSFEFWKKQSAVMGRLYGFGVEKYLKGVPEIYRAFQPRDRSVRCIDEGTPGGIHLAGSGILLSEERAAAILAVAKIDGIYSHAECGAAALYAGQKGLNVELADDYGKAWALRLAEKLGVPYKGHLELKEMQRPPGLHIARVIYYDGTGSFDPSLISEIPPGFVISRKYLDADYAKKEAEIAISIAFGPHGFGEKITKLEPFAAIAIGNSEDNLKKLKAELSDVAAARRGKVIVDGFVAPSIEE